MKKTNRWVLHPDCPEEAKNIFRDLDHIFKLDGKEITRDRSSKVIHVKINGTGYYIKYCRRPVKGLRRWIGHSRLLTEWKNLLLFHQWGIAAAQPVAVGTEKSRLIFLRGALITQEVPDTENLAELANRKDGRLTDPQWIKTVSGQVAHAARTMHQHRFAHGDMKWRNILVTRGENPGVYLIDCPAGRFWIPPFLQYRKNKDIACLDKYGHNVLSRTQRLRFYLNYLDRKRLTKKDKKNIRHIICFFLGRE